MVSTKNFMFVDGSVAWTSKFIIFIYIVLANVENSIILVEAFEEYSISPAPAVLSFDDVQAAREARCLRQSGWWSSTDHYNITYCAWSGITCNIAGSVAYISIAFKHTCRTERPLEILNLSCFPNLVRLDLSQTCIGGNIPLAMGTLSKLTHLDLSGSSLTGHLPLSLGNLSQLVVLDLSNNDLGGSIPREIGSLRNLVALNLSSNHFIGQIPSAIGLLTNLTDLDLSQNQIEGHLPLSLANLSQLAVLNLSNNYLGGSIPQEIGSLRTLVALNLSSNYFSGFIPVQIGSLKNLVLLDLSYNKLTGELPSTLFQLTKLLYLSLSNNLIIGFIDSEIGNLEVLLQLDLSSNIISGMIPSRIFQLAHLKLLNLSRNNINGRFPFEFCSRLYMFKVIDLSHNQITAEIPSHQLGNTTLLACYNLACNSLTSTYPSPFHSKIIKVVICTIFFTCMIFINSFVLASLSLIYTHWTGKRKAQADNRVAKNEDIFSLWNYDGKIAFEDIIQATKDFDIKYCIGTGGYGSVYRARLPNGKVVALKKLHSSEAEEPVFRKSFTNEVKTLSDIRHRNVVRLYGFCLHNRCMFLICEYMERGSLFCVLSNDGEAVELDWTKRVNIIKGTNDLDFSDL